MNTVSYLFPIGTLFTILGLTVFYHGVIMTWHLTLKLSRMLRRG